MDFSHILYEPRISFTGETRSIKTNYYLLLKHSRPYSSLGVNSECPRLGWGVTPLTFVLLGQ